MDLTADEQGRRPGVTVVTRRDRVAITEAGADEGTWRHCRALYDAPDIAWGRATRVLVVSPHPDDEALAIGGVLAHLHRRGFTITMVAVTDGEAARPDASVAERRRMAEVRTGERRSAARCLDLGSLPVLRLKLPDGGVAGVEDELGDRLAWLLGRIGSAGDPRPLCLAPWRRDGHPDHEASGRATAAAARRTGSPLFEFPVWAWQWLMPDDPRFPWARLRLQHLGPASRAAKARAVNQFVSQTCPEGGGRKPVLAADMLARFHRPFEGLLVGGPA
jgi:LmbE family N-acetylglucosaminyl deacetylase